MPRLKTAAAFAGATVGLLALAAVVLAPGAPERSRPHHRMRASVAGWHEARADGERGATHWGRVRIEPGRVVIGSRGTSVALADGDLPVVPPTPPVPPAAEVTGETDFDTFTAESVGPAPPAEPGDLPEWVTDPPAGRIVAAGQLEDHPAAALVSARRVAASALAEAAGVPGEAVSHGDVRRRERRSATEPVVTTTPAGHEYTLHRGRLLLDADARSLDDLRDHYRRDRAEGRAGLVAGLIGAAVGVFGGVWGVGRRRLRKA